MTGALADPPVAPIDPLAPIVDGRYEDALVTVAAVAGRRPARDARAVRTEHFDVLPRDGRIVVTHAVPPSALDDDLAGTLQDELFAPGWLRGAELFQRVFTGVVRTSVADSANPLDSWQLFYDNSLRRLDVRSDGRAPSAGRDCRDDSTVHGSLAGYAPVHEHALSLLGEGSVLELGCSFGFLSLRIARTGRATTASDVSAGTVGLLAAMAARWGVPLDTVTADAARIPRQDGDADTVLAIHLLEHLEPAHGTHVLNEALRLAARRVVVAVPLEGEANETYGHVRTVSLADLHRWGRAAGLPHHVYEHHGGWLVLDKRRPAGHSPPTGAPA